MTPEPELDALQFFSRRAPTPSPRRTADWAKVMPDVRAKAFFVASVNDARFLDRAHGLIGDHLAGGDTTDRGTFVRRMREFMVEEGMVDPSDFGDERDITNIASERRLQLIFDTQTRQAHGYAYRSQGLDPVLLDAWPAARFVRTPGATDPRPRHVAGEGDVRLKLDTAYWADFQNAPEIGGFGVPWAPYGFNSYMSQEDVRREEAEALGLLAPSRPAAPPETLRRERETPVTRGVWASVKNMAGDVLAGLLGVLSAAAPAAFGLADLLAESAAQEREEELWDEHDLAVEEGDEKKIGDILEKLQTLQEEREERGTGAIFDHQLGGDGILRMVT
jgi:hypothetical protein